MLLGVNRVAQLDVRTEGPAPVKNGQTHIRINIKTTDDAGRDKPGLAAPQPLRGNIIRPVDGRAEKFAVHAGKFKSGRVQDGDGIVIVLALKVLIAGKVAVKRKSLKILGKKGRRLYL